MAKLQWDKESEKLYETGVSKCVLFVWDSSKGEKGDYGNGVAWNGISSVSESPEGAEANDIYADNTKYLSLFSAEKLGATVEAYMYPEAFEACDGSAGPIAGLTLGQQTRKTFALSYETILGNDTDNNEYGKKIHILYGCKASPSEKSYETVNDSPEAITFSWEISTTPLPAETIDNIEYKPTASVVIDSTKISEAALAAIEAKLYGTEEAESELLKPAAIYEIIRSNPKTQG